MSQPRVFSHPPVKASSIIGTDVVNPEGDSLGDIKEVVIDPRTGKVAYAVVSFGGFLGMGEKLFAIPFSACVQRAEKRIRARCFQGAIEGGAWIRRGSLAFDGRGKVEPRRVQVLRAFAVLGIAPFFGSARHQAGRRGCKAILASRLRIPVQKSPRKTGAFLVVFVSSVVVRQARAAAFRRGTAAPTRPRRGNRVQSINAQAARD